MTCSKLPVIFLFLEDLGPPPKPLPLLACLLRLGSCPEQGSKSLLVLIAPRSSASTRASSETLVTPVFCRLGRSPNFPLSAAWPRAFEQLAVFKSPGDQLFSYPPPDTPRCCSVALELASLVPPTPLRDQLGFWLFSSDLGLAISTSSFAWLARLTHRTCRRQSCMADTKFSLQNFSLS